MADTSTAGYAVAARALVAAVTQGQYNLDPEDVPNEAVRIRAELALAIRALSQRIFGDPRIRAYLLGIAAELEGEADA